MTRKLTSFLNKMTPEKYDILFSQIKRLNINTESRMGQALDLIYAKAVNDQAFCVQYAMVCKHLSPLLPQMMAVDEEGREEIVNFQKLLVIRCLREFQRDVYQNIDLEVKEKAVKDCESREKREDLVLRLDIEKRSALRTYLGNVNLIGQLYSLDVIKGDTVYCCLRELLDKATDESLECLCTLLPVVGGKLVLELRVKETTGKTKPGLLEPCFGRLADIVREKKTSAKITLMVQTLLELRGNWGQSQGEEDKVMAKVVEHSTVREDGDRTNIKGVGNSAGHAPRKEVRTPEKWFKSTSRPEKADLEAEQIRRRLPDQRADLVQPNGNHKKDGHSLREPLNAKELPIREQPVKVRGDPFANSSEVVTCSTIRRGNGNARGIGREAFKPTQTRLQQNNRPESSASRSTRDTKHQISRRASDESRSKQSESLGSRAERLPVGRGTRCLIATRPPPPLPAFGEKTL